LESLTLQACYIDWLHESISPDDDKLPEEVEEYEIMWSDEITINHLVVSSLRGDLFTVLGDNCGFVFIRIDLINKHITRYYVNVQSKQDDATAEITKRVYGVMFKRAGKGDHYIPIEVGSLKRFTCTSMNGLRRIDVTIP
jgi:hypothetical protein